MARQLFGGYSASVATWAADLVAPSKHFVLFVAADTQSLSGPQVYAAAEAAVRAGASYVCCWGPDCSRFHDAFDEADLYLNGESSDAKIIVTTWHDDEPLEEALWFAVHSTLPSPFYEPSTRAVLAVAIDNRAWATQIDAYLASGAPLVDEV
jgi:hypothetical protein